MSLWADLTESYKTLQFVKNRDLVQKRQHSSTRFDIVIIILLGPCPSRGALVSGIVTLSQYPFNLTACNAMKFDVYPFVWVTFSGCYGNIMVAMTTRRCP